jgi:hypothetical protein
MAYGEAHPRSGRASSSTLATVLGCCGCGVEAVRNERCETGTGVKPFVLYITRDGNYSDNAGPFTSKGQSYGDAWIILQMEIGS